jgi:hypothetical protein
MTGLLHDLRYAVRTWRKNPGFTAVAAATIAVGISRDDRGLQPDRRRCCSTRCPCRIPIAWSSSTSATGGQERMMGATAFSFARYEAYRTPRARSSRGWPAIV